jgi:hypothetical protein
MKSLPEHPLATALSEEAAPATAVADAAHATWPATHAPVDARGPALPAGGASVAIATLVGIVATTWIIGRIARMNPAAVFISLLFWGWPWGVLGMLLSIPIRGRGGQCAGSRGPPARSVLLLVVLADLVADDAADNGTAHGPDRAAAGEDRASDRSGACTDGGVLVLAGHPGATRESEQRGHHSGATYPCLH